MWPLITTLLSKVVPFLTGINIPSLLGGVWSAIKAIAQNIVTNWKIWLIVLLVFAQVGGVYLINHERDLYTNEKLAHAQDNAKFALAQKLANIQEQNVKQQLQTESKVAKHEADTNYSALLVKYNASLMRYATTHSKSVTAATGNNQFSAPQSVVGPSESSSLPQQIIITGQDAEICAENTARLKAAHDWAIQQLTTEKKTDEDATQNGQENASQSNGQ